MQLRAPELELAVRETTFLHCRATTAVAAYERVLGAAVSPASGAALAARLRLR